MKKILLSTLCIALFFIGCKTDKAKNEKAVESTSIDSISASKSDTTLPTKIKFQINDEVPQALLWKNILFKLSREELAGDSRCLGEKKISELLIEHIEKTSSHNSSSNNSLSSEPKSVDTV